MPIVPRKREGGGSPVPARYVKLVAKSEVNGHAFAAAAEVAVAAE
jgi:hypothetical protein